MSGGVGVHTSGGLRFRLPAGVALGLGMLGCQDPSVTNTTPPSVTRTEASAYALTATVAANGNLIEGVEARVFGVDWPMSPVASGSNDYAVTYFASPCLVTIPYTFQVDYRARNVLGDGYSSTVETLVDPPVGAHLLRVSGSPPEGCPANFGRVFQVNSTVDAVDANLGDGVCQTAAGTCTLRAAVMQANASAGHDWIEVASGNYVLTLTGDETTDSPDETFGDLDVTDAVSIRGAGTQTTVVDGNGVSRLFDLHALADPGFVRIERMTLRNGFELGKPGGAVFNRTALQLHRVLLQGNKLDGYVGAGTCANSSARVCNRGGALFNEGSALITESTLQNNNTCNSSSDSCSSTTGQGGAISNYGSAAELIVERSTLASNAARFAGGIHNLQGSVTLTNSTLTRHWTSGWATDVFNFGGTVVLNSVTVAEPMTDAAPMLANSSGAEGSLSLTNSIVYTNIESWPVCSGTVNFGFANFVRGSVSSCAVSGVDPTVGYMVLGALENNGGPTQTIRVLDSTLDGAIRPKDNGALCPAVDQRNVARPRDADGDGTATCDAGAVEH